MGMDIREFNCQLEEWKLLTGKKDIDFCREAGISANTLVNWKKGKSAPQAKKMERICNILGIKEVDLAPLSFYTAKDNENKLYYRTQQLQRYANANGLDDNFYKQITSKPYFVKEFPFADTTGRFNRLKCPEYYAEDEKYLDALNSIPLTKFEFQDSYGKIIMITEKDVDFLIKLQRKGEQLIRDEFYLESHRIEEQKNRRLVKFICSEYVENGKRIDPDHLYEELTQTDFSERIITSQTIWERFNEYAEKHNVQLRPIDEVRLESIENRHPPMSIEEEKAWRAHYVYAGMNEEEIEEQMQWREKIRQFSINYEKEVYGIKDKEDENNGRN